MEPGRASNAGRVFRAGVLAALLSALAAAIPLWHGRGVEAALERTYRIGWTDLPPLQVRGEDGRPSGLAVELLRDAAARRGIRLEWVYTEEDPESALRNGHVDLWPVVTITPDRRKRFFISEPLLETDHCLLVRDDSRLRKLTDLGAASIGTSNLTIDGPVLRRRFPQARIVTRTAVRELVADVCAGRADAAYMNEYSALAVLLERRDCGGFGLRWISTMEERSRLGIGATFDAAPIARILRDEVAVTAAEHKLGPVVGRWGYLSSNIEAVSTVLESRRRELRLVATAALFALLLLMAVFQAARIRRGRNRTRRAEEALRRAHGELEQRVADRTLELSAANARLQELDRLKSQFLASMSHELRTPLNSIIGFGSLLRKELTGPVNAEQKKQLDIICKSSRHLLTLINDLLDVSRIEAGRADLQPEPFDFNDVATEVVQSILPQAGTKGLEVTADLPPGGVQLFQDRKRTLQLLLNLVYNAVKFTARGSVRITARTAGEKLVVAVEDTGIGIRPEHLGMLFEAFRQVDGSARKVYEGTGLGLYLCKKLLELMSGAIRVESEYGKGSRFEFELPLRAHAAPPAEVQAQA